MRKLILTVYNYLRYRFWFSPFKRMLVDTNNSSEGMVTLFDKKFHYHIGSAFYTTYKELFEKNIYEFKTSTVKPIIIDCGANMGLSVLYFSKQFPHAEIVAFEPDLSVLPFLEKNINSQELNNVKLYKNAVWTKEEELTFYTDKNMGGRIGVEYKNQTPIKIKALRLKDFLKQPVDMLKMDIEGAEYEVLKDCEELLYNVKNIFLEYHSFYNEEQHLEEILSIFKRQGFRYHLKESFSRGKPFVSKGLVCEKYDMAINVYAYKE
jgi:FkbM family methyltransferase